MPIELEDGILLAVQNAARDRSVLDVPGISKRLSNRFPDAGLTRKTIADELIRRGIEARANILMDSRAG